jgi:hypothetical protein
MRPLGQRLVLGGAPIAGLRLARAVAGRQPWAIAGLRIEVEGSPLPDANDARP